MDYVPWSIQQLNCCYQIWFLSVASVWPEELIQIESLEALVEVDELMFRWYQRWGFSVGSLQVMYVLLFLGKACYVCFGP